MQDAEIPHLKTIIPKAVAAERHRQRHRKYTDRATHLETRKETAEQRQALARLLRAKGLSWADVGKEMGISPDAAEYCFSVKADTTLRITSGVALGVLDSALLAGARLLPLIVIYVRSRSADAKPGMAIVPAQG